MVTIAMHGGSCCGARHIYSFDRDDNNRPDNINRALANVPYGRMVEAILNTNQMRTMPNVLQRLKDLGFVLTDVYVNQNHGPANLNYRFSRCDNRRALTSAAAWWSGMVANVLSNSDLPALNTRGNQLALADQNQQVYYSGVNLRTVTEPNRIFRHEPGAVWRCDSPNSRYRGRYCYFTRRNGARMIFHPIHENGVIQTWDEGSIVERNMVYIAPPYRHRPRAQQEVAVPQEAQVHDQAILLQADQRTVAARAGNGRAAAPQQPRVVLTQYYREYQDGRIGTYVFESEAAAREGHTGQRRAVSQLEILSDGTTRRETLLPI